MTYKIGQILTSNQDVEVEKLFGGTVVIPKGNQIIIGAKGYAYHLRNGMMQPLAEEDKVEGYDTEGIAEFLYRYLRMDFPIDEMLEDYDETADSFKKCISEALDELDF